MDWARIMAPLSGGEGDRRVLAGAVVLARAFEAELLGVHAPPDLADMAPWVGDGFMGGVQMAGAVDTLRQAADEGERLARSAVEALEYDKATFVGLRSPVWAALAMAGRLSDVIVFDDQAGKARGPLDRVFQQIVADEQRPTLVMRGAFRVGGVAVIAWDGGKEASRAMRTALPLLRKASSVILLAAPAATQRKIDPDELTAFLAARGVSSTVKVLSNVGDPAPALLNAASEVGADILVAGAFGHTRLREFVFGGATRAFLGADSPSLFLSH